MANENARTSEAPARFFHGLHRAFPCLLVITLLTLGALVACTDQDAESSDADSEDSNPGSLQVVVTLPVFPSMVEAVGGEQVTIDSIVPPGVDTHTYQPSPSDAQLIAEADLIFVNGLGLEEFLDDLIESAGGVDAPVVELAGGMQDETIEDDDHEGHEHEDAHEDDDHEEHDETQDHDHEHEDGNPHLWLDPGYGTRYVEIIANQLAELDPDNADTYQQNADDYIAEIEEFDQWASDQISGIPEEKRVMVTVHDAFPYFAEHFGLDVIGVVITSPGREPGAQEAAELSDRIQDLDAPAIFIEPQFNPDLAQTIADESGLELVEIYSDAPPEGAGYLEMMQLNVERVVEGLS